MAYRSNYRQIKARLLAATDAGLVAAGDVVKAEVQEGLRDGYTSGDFVTGNVFGSVTRTEPDGPFGGRFVLVGSDVMYALFYEVGHFNIFRRKFTRVEIWVPALFSTRAQQLEAFNRAFSGVLSGSNN